MIHTGYHIGSLFLDLDRGALVTKHGNDIQLRPKSFALLHLLARNAGCLLSHQIIMDAIWPDVFVTENNINQCIGDIRAALASEGRDALRTVPCRGYRLELNVVAALGQDTKDSPSKASDRRTWHAGLTGPDEVIRGKFRLRHHLSDNAQATRR